MAKPKTTTALAYRPDMQSTQGFMVATANYDADSFRVIGVYSNQEQAKSHFNRIKINNNEGKFIIPVITAN